MYHRLSRSTDQKSRSQRNIVYQHQKNAIIHARISCQTSNLVKIIPEPTATRYMEFKVIRSNTEITITADTVARLCSNLVQFHNDKGDTLQMFKVKGQSHSIKYCISSKNATKRLWTQRFRSWHGIVLKAEKDCRGSGGLKFQCIHNCHVF